MFETFISLSSEMFNSKACRSSYFSAKLYNPGFVGGTSFTDKPTNFTECAFFVLYLATPCRPKGHILHGH